MERLHRWLRRERSTAKCKDGKSARHNAPRVGLQVSINALLRAFQSFSPIRCRRGFRFSLAMKTKHRFRSLPLSLFFFFFVSLASLYFAAESKCTRGCDLALASYYVWVGVDNMTWLSEIMQSQLLRSSQDIASYNKGTASVDYVRTTSRVNVPFPCDCIGGEFLGHVFTYPLKEGDTYTTVANQSYSNLTTDSFLQSSNSYRPTNIPDSGTLNVTVNCSCGNSKVSKDYGLFVTYPLRDDDSLESIANQSDLDPVLLQRYNPGVNFSKGSGLVYIPGRGLAGGIVAGISVGAVAGVLVLAACVFVVYYRNKKLEEGKLLSEESKVFTQHGKDSNSPAASLDTGITGITVHKSVEFSYEELAQATNNFSMANKIGQGGFGAVYYAELRGEKAAVKKMEMQASREFLAELRVLTNVHHLNLVLHLSKFKHLYSVVKELEGVEEKTLSTKEELEGAEEKTLSTRGELEKSWKQAKITTFSKLIERSMKTVASIRKANKSGNKKNEGVPLMTVATVEEKQPKNTNQQEDGCQFYQVPPPANYDTKGETRPPSWRGRPPPPYPCSMEDVYALLEIWTRDGAGPLRIEGVEEIEEVNFIEEDDHVIVAKGLVKSTNFRAFFDLLEFDEEAKTQAALSIAEIAKNMGGSCCAVTTNMRKIAKAHQSTIIFKDTERAKSGGSHNKPLYVEAQVAELKIRRAMIDGGSSVNIIPYSVLKKSNYLEHLIEKSSTTLGSFNGGAIETVGVVTLSLRVGPFLTANKFHVIDSNPSYHVLLGRPWIHAHDVPSTLHQCVKSNHKGKDIEISATQAPFDEDETHFFEALFLDDYVGRGMSLMASPKGVALEKKKGKMEDLKKEDIKVSKDDMKASSSGSKRTSVEIFEVKGRRIEKSIMNNGRPKYRCL
ncbi:lysM domain receptor-like kinase 3 isoform X1 [Senna tora]|uniref:LysM domain receptor-like kinase 3 isoform X1 n=1 Tax=Senna tora TaxID=362788 RepID=A0A834T2U3_9FABA|nr:lysM domain receptor-like kinase 3 isoform X1 [Senna tora]